MIPICKGDWKACFVKSENNVVIKLRNTPIGVFEESFILKNYQECNLTYLINKAVEDGNKEAIQTIVELVDIESFDNLNTDIKSLFQDCRNFLIFSD